MPTTEIRTKAGFWEMLESRPWSEVLAEKWGDYPSPLTVHLPIQPPHPPDAVHVGPAFEVARQRILPGLSAHNVDEARSAAQLETLLVQFGFGAAPSVPEFRRTRMSIEPDGTPIARAELYAYEGLLYRFEYFCEPGEDLSQSLLWVRGTVENRKNVPLPAHVWVKVNCTPENELFDYHYAPYYWDASKYLPSPEIGLNRGTITRCGQPIGKINPGDWSTSWVDQVELPPDAYPAADFQFSPPHLSLRLPNLQHAIHLSVELAPGEAREFSLAFLTAFESPSERNLRWLEFAKPGEGRAKARARFEKIHGRGDASLQCEAGEWGTLFAHMPLAISQLLIRFPGVEGLVPTQGGTSERHFVWVGEAPFMLLPLLKLGNHELVKEALRYIFSFQDSGYAPQGRLTTTAGAIGTSGPKWLNSTGMALNLAAEYERYSHDGKFIKEYLPRILRALDWIAGELRATRQAGTEGNRPPWAGLMPFGCATDGDIGYVIAYTDAYTFLGMEKSVAMLERLGHERAAEFRHEVELYRAALAGAAQYLSREDGYIDRKFVTGDPEEDLYEPFDQICGAYHLIAGNALEVDTTLFERYISYFERTLGDRILSGQMDDDTMYIGVGEWVWQEIYLRRGEWKKAFAVTQINLRYGKTRGAHQVQERFRLSDVTFCPWQPNGSGAGRILDMMLKSLVFEYRGVTTLFGAFPFAWLRQNGLTQLENLHTPHGLLNLRAEMLDDTRCEVCISADSAAALPARLRFPEHFEVLEHDTLPGKSDSGDTAFSPETGACVATFVVREFSKQ